MHMSTSFFKWGSIGYSLGIVQWDFTRRDHLGNPGRVSGSGLVNIYITYDYRMTIIIREYEIYTEHKIHIDCLLRTW